MSLSAAQAAPIFSTIDSQNTSAYTQVDCMERDGGPTGCPTIGSNYRSDTGFFGQGQSRIQSSSDARAYFDNSRDAKTNSLQDVRR